MAKEPFDVVENRIAPAVPVVDSGIKPIDYLSLVPLAGGALHGIARPPRGSNRFEAASLQGFGGLGGGAVGGLTGLGLGAALGGLLMKGSTNGEATAKAVATLALLGGLGGSMLGTAGGSYLGRKMVERDSVTPEELMANLEQMELKRRLRQGG